MKDRMLYIQRQQILDSSRTDWLDWGIMGTSVRKPHFGRPACFSFLIAATAAHVTAGCGKIVLCACFWVYAFMPREQRPLLCLLVITLLLKCNKKAQSWKRVETFARDKSNMLTDKRKWTIISQLSRSDGKVRSSLLTLSFSITSRRLRYQIIKYREHSNLWLILSSLFLRLTFPALNFTSGRHLVNQFRDLFNCGDRRCDISRAVFSLWTGSYLFLSFQFIPPFYCFCLCNIVQYRTGDRGRTGKQE